MDYEYQQIPNTNEEWVLVRNCVWIQETQVVKSVLQAGGVEGLIPDEHFLGANPHYGIAIGGARVMVRSSDVERARVMLDPMEGSEAAHRAARRELARLVRRVHGGGACRGGAAPTMGYSTLRRLWRVMS